jgi:hypothetical protein
MTRVGVKKLEADGLVLSHGRWSPGVTERSRRPEMSGLGTIVSRRRPGDTWRILLDDLLAGVWTAVRWPGEPPPTSPACVRRARSGTGLLGFRPVHNSHDSSMR